MTTRQVRRAAERKANKADKAAYKAGLSIPQPDIDRYGQPIETQEELDTLIEEQREALQVARLQRQAERAEPNAPNPKGGPRTPEGKATPRSTT